MKSEELKKIVKEKYSEIPRDNTRTDNNSCCQGDSSCGTNCQDFYLDYSKLPGYNPNADYHLGCGIPTEFAQIKPGDSVLDLGSGAGNDCFVVRAITGESGKVTGIDFTEEMVLKAKNNLEKLGYKNMHFIQGDIEHMPLPDNNFDVVVSNCVLNLVPDKQRAYDEVYRVLKKGGHFCISDIVLIGSLPKKIKEAAEMYAGCVSGAIGKSAYLNVIKNTGFDHIEIKSEREIYLSDELLLEHLDKKELTEFRKSGAGIISVTITAVK